MRAFPVVIAALFVAVAFVPARSCRADDAAAPRGAAPQIDFETTRGTPAKVALLVGISNYPAATANEWAPLPGSVNDVARVRELLVSRFGFDPADVFVLLDAQATHENVVRGFHEWLIRRAGPETEALFWFSGHGSRVPDASGMTAEAEGKDATYLAYDSRLDGRDGEYDITDDEFRSLLLALTAKTPRVTVITDSCFSGGGMRGQGRKLTARSARPGSRARDTEVALPFWPQDVPFHDDGHGPALDAARYVHISACTNRQQAYEWCVKDAQGLERPYGALTFFLTNRLECASPGDSYRTVADAVARRVATRIPEQSVCREGAVDRRLFDGAFEEPPPGFAARVLSGDARDVAVDAGKLHGLRKGSVLALLDPEGREIGTATIVRATSIEAIARLDADVPAGAAELPLRAIERSRPGGGDVIEVFAADPALAAVLATVPGVEVVAEEPDSPCYRLERGERIVLRAPDGVPVWRSQPAASDAGEQATGEPSLRNRLEAAVRQELRYQGTLALAHEAGSLRLEAAFVPLREDELIGPDGEGGASWTAAMIEAPVRPLAREDGGAAASPEFVATVPRSDDGNPLVALEVKNPTSRDLHIAVLSVAEDRSIHVIWPIAEGQTDNLIGAGESRRIHAVLVWNDQLGLERPMRDRYLVIATESYANFHPLVAETLLRSRGSSDVPALIEDALLGPVTRGRRVDVQRTADFGVTTVDLLVEPE